ncbi:hypothetical protein [Mesorhizobium xinjiangense]|uniref:hypothetical protein n=1 Tax=Mesorhizobium xinjiangense TaxID=2678685 RepID=UPI0012EDA045|nr:hypothetical protein [Mesorhizobium xinjiangense]
MDRGERFRSDIALPAPGRLSSSCFRKATSRARNLESCRRSSEFGRAVHPGKAEIAHFPSRRQRDRWLAASTGIGTSSTSDGSTDLGEDTIYNDGTFAIDEDVSFHAIKVGLNFRF